MYQADLVEKALKFCIFVEDAEYGPFSYICLSCGRIVRGMICRSCRSDRLRSLALNYEVAKRIISGSDGIGSTRLHEFEEACRVVLSSMNQS